ncbi:chromate resistance protein ChrB domain-containing protein [Dawidia cretensis]
MPSACSSSIHSTYAQKKTDQQKSCVMKWITRDRPKIDRIACPWLTKLC